MTGDWMRDFIEAACVPLDADHGGGTLERAEAIRAAHPEIAASGIHAAAVLGDENAVRRFLADDAASATARGGPRGWDALTHLCFSRYLRLDPSRSAGFVGAAGALLDAGASANTGFFAEGHQLEPQFESVLYGAAGIAHHSELTRLLLDRGADPNDNEAVYHSPETYDSRAMMVLVETGRLTADNMSMMLVRKHDWHDHNGVRWLLEHGADPNRDPGRGWRPLHHAIVRDNSREIVELSLDHGGDPALLSEGRSAVSLAARRGRGDLLELFERRGVPVALQGVERLIAACARNDAGQIEAISTAEPNLAAEVAAEGGKLLCEFAGVGNAEGVARLLDLGLDVLAPFQEGDRYFDAAENSTALHVAAWRANHEIVRLLIDRGAAVDLPDGKGRTPLALAVRACVDAFWSDRRSPESVAALLNAGAKVEAVPFPSGYAEVDDLLRRHGARSA